MHFVKLQSSTLNLLGDTLLLEQLNLGDRNFKVPRRSQRALKNNYIVERVHYIWPFAMATYRRFLLCLSFLTALVNYALASHSFENTAIVRTIELAGSLIHLKTTFAARALETGTLIYTFALGKEDGEKTSFMEARFRGEDTPLEIQKFGFNAQTCVLSYLYYNARKSDLWTTQEYVSIRSDATQRSEEG